STRGRPERVGGSAGPPGGQRLGDHPRTGTRTDRPPADRPAVAPAPGPCIEPCPETLPRLDPGTGTGAATTGPEAVGPAQRHHPRDLGQGERRGSHERRVTRAPAPCSTRSTSMLPN